MLGEKVSKENLESILDLEQRALGRISPDKLEHLGYKTWVLDGFSLRLMRPKVELHNQYIYIYQLINPSAPPFWWLKSLRPYFGGYVVGIWRANKYLYISITNLMYLMYCVDTLMPLHAGSFFSQSSFVAHAGWLYRYRTWYDIIISNIIIYIQCSILYKNL